MNSFDPLIIILVPNFQARSKSLENYDSNPPKLIKDLNEGAELVKLHRLFNVELKSYSLEAHF